MPAPEVPRVRSQVLRHAETLIAGPREADYGDATESFTRISVLWGEVLGCKVSAEQVALCMVLLKVSRAVESTQADTYVDIAGYAALAAELAGVQQVP